MTEVLESSSVPRPKLLDGFLTDRQLEAEMGWQSRTRLRREAEGLPVVVIGVLKLYPIDKVREWIFSRVRQHPARGRATNQATERAVKVA